MVEPAKQPCGRILRLVPLPDGGLLTAGVDDRRAWRSADGGITWTSTSLPGPVRGRPWTAGHAAFILLAPPSPKPQT
ncbi:MAG: sialidase family protein [Thermaerobacter sp.]|jgi:hypothetical protein|nr:sialidase family protein [Thermaerobacter sp.]